MPAGRLFSRLADHRQNPPRDQQADGARPSRKPSQQTLRLEGDDHLVRRRPTHAEVLRDVALRRSNPWDLEVLRDEGQVLELSGRDLDDHGDVAQHHQAEPSTSRCVSLSPIQQTRCEPLLSPSESDAGHSSGDEGLSADFGRIEETTPVAHREDGDLALL